MRRRHDNSKHDNPLSPRQQEILDLMGLGLKVSAIAAQLGISENTVKARKKSIYAKLRARSCGHAVNVMHQIRKAA
jgi:DNA-binding NarL/FixJ family response regulator